jgi:hypothetical protein
MHGGERGVGQLDRGELPLGVLCARPELVEATLVTFLFVEIAFSRTGVDWPYRGCDCYLGSQDMTSRSLSQQDLRTPGRAPPGRRPTQRASAMLTARR